MKILIIVESPAKARKVAEFASAVFGGEVRALACLGHLRDLPPNTLGIDTAHNFAPVYQIPPYRQQTVARLRTAIQHAEQVIIASDPDNEGEAVAWHIAQVFRSELQGKQVLRARFHAITPQAVQTALRQPVPLSIQRVQAAVARRVADRLVGYTLSPVLWRNVRGRNLSAGRVQTAALRLLIEAQAAPRFDVDVEL